jgi:hypothetical protein
MSPDAWNTEVDAEKALFAMMPAISSVNAAMAGVGLDVDLRSRMLAAAVRDSLAEEAP